MPVFEFEGKTYNNPAELAIDKIGGKWKMPILWRLRERTWRYGEMRKSLGSKSNGVTHQMLTKQLRELEADGFVARKVYPVVPPKVEYTITDKGLKVIPVIDALRDFGHALMKE